MTVPQQITCVLRANTTTTTNTKCPQNIEDGRQVLREEHGLDQRHPTLLPDHAVVSSSSSYDEAVIVIDEEEETPSKTTNRSVFRPLSDGRAQWCPPLYRDTSLLTSPSRDCHTLSSSSSASSAEGGQSPSSLPEDFIPPRHNFASSSSASTSTTTHHHRSLSLRPDDIICGRGAPGVNFHPGNRAFRELIQQYETDYLCAKRKEKSRIALEVLTTLKTQGVRFVKRDSSSSSSCSGSRAMWVEIGEKAEYEKVCQSLRDRGPEMRRHMMLAKATIQAKKANTNTVNTAVLFEDDSLFFREESFSPIPFSF